MKTIFRILISTILIISTALGISSCNKRPETVLTETESYYSYVNLEYGDHERNYLDLTIPKGDNVPGGIILYIHGGGWIAGEKEVYVDTMKFTAERGYICAAINYRYANGKKVTLDEILDDIDAALDKIKLVCNERGITVDRVLLTGGSAGGHLSLMYAYTRKDTAPLSPVAAISYSGPTDLYDPNFYTTVYEREMKNMISKVSGANIVKKNIDDAKDALLEASPISYVNESTVPTILCHGTVDDIVPYSNATSLHELLCSYGVECELITFDNSGHGLESDAEATEYADKRFFELAEKYLK